MSEASEKSCKMHREDDSNPMRPLGDVGAMITSDVLMQGRREIVIVHDGLNYRLRITSNNKLILTK